MRTLRTFAAAVMALSILGAEPAGAITGNYEKDFVHDYVALLVFHHIAPDSETGDTFDHRCSGTLISPTVLVTAGHCTAGFDRGRAYFEQAVAPNYDPNAYGGLGGDVTTGYPYENGVTFSRADNYRFDGSGLPDTGDVGVVVLDTPYTPPSGLFGALPARGAVDVYAASTRSKQNVRFLSSGYGLSDYTPRIVSFRERLMASGYLVENTTGLTEYNLKTTANPAQGKGGSCSGDSGGPVFFDGTRVIAAVVSFGMNHVCVGLDFSYRLDRAEVLAWILDPGRVDAG